jgi:hypothetical protein
MNYDVPSCGNLQAIPPANFADAPADPIAEHSASQRFLDADAESALRSAVRAIKNHELRRTLPAASAIHSLEFGAALQARNARISLGRAF